MKKELATKQTQELSTDVLSDWGTPQVMGQDIVISKILPMQPTSVMVGDMKAQIGEFRDSVSGNKLGSIVEPLDVIPFHIQKFWDILEQQDDDQYKWVRSEPLIENPTDAGYNDNLTWSDTVNGVAIKRVRRMNFFVLLPSEVANGTHIPYILSFKSTSFKEGKKVFTQMYLRNRKANLPPPAYTFKLGGIKTKNDKGTFIVPSVELSRRSTPEEVNACLEWYKLINKGGVKVDDSDLKENTTAADDTGTGEF